MKRLSHCRSALLAAIATVLAVGGVGHGLHWVLGIEHGCAAGCCELDAPLVAAASGGADRPTDGEPQARRADCSDGDCLLCELLNSYRTRGPDSAASPCGADLALLRPALGELRVDLAAQRRPPARGPPLPAPSAV